MLPANKPTFGSSCPSSIHLTLITSPMCGGLCFIFCRICARHTPGKGCGATKKISNGMLLVLQKLLLSSMNAGSPTGTPSHQTFCWTRRATKNWQISGLRRLAAAKHGLVSELRSTVLLKCHEVLAMMQPWIGARLVVFFLNYGQASLCLQEKSMIFSVPLRASIRLVQQAFRDATA